MILSLAKLLAAALQGIELVVSALFLDQLVVRALLDDLAVREQNDLIGAADGGKSVRDDEHGSDIHHALERSLDQNLGFGIDIGGCLVKDHDLRTVDDGTGKGEQLSLARREVISSLTNLLVEPLRKTVDEGIGVDVAACLSDLVVSDRLVAQDDVRADRSREKEDVLEHLSELAAKRRELDTADIDAVEQDLAPLNIVIAAKEREDGGLSASRRADEGGGLPRLHREGNVLENPILALVGKPNVFKLHSARDAVKLDGVGSIDDLGSHIEHREDLFRRGERRLQPVELLGKALDRVKELRDEHIEADDGTARNALTEKACAVNVALSAKVKEAQHRRDVEHIDDRAEDAENEDLALLCSPEAAVLLGELGELLLFAVEDLRDLHAREVLGEEGIDVGRAVLDTTVGAARELAEDDRKKQDKGNETQHHQRQEVVEAEHRHEHADDDKGVLDEVDDDVGKEHRDGARIVGHTSDELPYGNVIKLVMREPLDMHENVLAESRDDLLPRSLKHDRLNVGTDERNDEDGAVYRHVGKKPRHPEPAFAEHFLNASDEDGRDDIVGNRHKHHSPDEEKAPDVGPRIPKQPTKQLSVCHMAVKADGCLFVLHGRIGNRKEDRKKPDNSADNEKRIPLTH